MNRKLLPKGLSGTALVIVIMLGVLCGSFAFYLYTNAQDYCGFGNPCSGNVKTVTLSSATFNYGSRLLNFSLNNPGAQTTMSSATVNGIACVGSGIIMAGQVTSSSCKVTSGNFTKGETVNYVFNFANGQSVSGSLTAQ